MFMLNLFGVRSLNFVNLFSGIEVEQTNPANCELRGELDFGAEVSNLASSA